MAEWTEQDVKQIREWNEKDHPRGQPKNAGQFVEKSTKRTRNIKLPQKEYAAVCSAIRTKYGHKIPLRGDLLHGEYYYRYRYIKRQEKIECTFKLSIEGNEAQIAYMIRELKNDR